jgi:hypothetical protein
MSVRAFPDAPEFTGLNSPLGEEYELEHLPVEGRIPAEVAGTFFRAVPDPAFPPYLEDGAAVIAGDGMVSALRFAGGKVSFAIRYVRPGIYSHALRVIKDDFAAIGNFLGINSAVAFPQVNAVPSRVHARNFVFPVNGHARESLMVAGKRLRYQKQRDHDCRN